MKHLQTSALCIALLASAPAVVHAEVVVIKWDRGGRFAHSVSIAPAKFAELCGKLSQGVPVSWDFSAPRPLDFNIHYHEGKKVVFPAKQDGVASAQGRLEVKLDQDYCWMWSNKSTAPVELQVQLQR